MEQENRMGTVPVEKLVPCMAFPPLFSMFLQYSYNLVDSIFVSALGEPALAAISLAYPLTTCMNAASIWIGVGVNILVARRLGQGDRRGADAAAAGGIGLSLLLGVVLNLAVLTGLGPYFHFFARDGQVRALCMDYMGICAFMQIPNMVHIMVQKILQGTGNMVGPMWFQAAGVLFNLVFDPILIFGWFGFPAMGIRGAALSTVLGFALSMALALGMLLGAGQRVRIRAAELRCSRDIAAQIFRLGFPSFLMNALGACMAGVVNAFLMGYSQTAVAFYGAYLKIQQMFAMTVNGLIQGCLPVMSFHYGAGRHERMRRAYRCGARITNGLLALGVLLLQLFPAQILRLFQASEAMLALGVPAVRVLSPGLLCIGVSSMAATWMQASEHAAGSILVHLLRQVLLPLPLLWGFSAVFGLEGIWRAFLAAEAVTALAALCLQGRCGGLPRRR